GVALFLVMVAGTAMLWRITPGSLVPDEDQGFYIAAVYLPDGSSLQRTDEVVKQVSDIVRSNKANENCTAFAGFDFLGGGFKAKPAPMFIPQPRGDERPGVDPKQRVGELFMKPAGLRDALVVAFAPPPILGLGTAGGCEVWLQNQGEGGPQCMAEV